MTDETPTGESTASESPLVRWLAPAAALLAMWALAVLRPFYAQLWRIPGRLDSDDWIIQGATDAPGWLDWCLLQGHFVGYRPVTALSFSIDHLLFGHTTWGYHGTDLVLHGLAAAAIYVLIREWSDAPVGWCLLAPALFLIHPAAEEVVPHLESRSYPLAVIFGCLSLASLFHAARQERWLGWSALGTGLLALALLSNEHAFVLVPLILIDSWVRTPERGVLPAPLRGPLLVALAVFGLRWAVIGGLGGYGGSAVAHIEDGRKLPWSGEAGLSTIVVGAWGYTWFPSSAGGVEGLWRTGWGWAGAVVIGAYYVWQALIVPVRDKTARGRWVLLIWMLGYALLWSLFSTWFWRQGYPMVVPLALLVTTIAYRAMSTSSDLEAALHGIAPVLVVVGLLGRSPTVAGTSFLTEDYEQELTDLAWQIDEEMEALEQGDQVYFVLSMRRRPAQRVLRWAEWASPDRAVDLRLVGAWGKRPSHGAVPEFSEVKGRQQLVMPFGELVALGPLLRDGVAGKARDGRYWLDALYSPPPGRSWLYWIDESGQSHLDPIPSPPIDEGRGPRPPKPGATVITRPEE